MYLLQMPEQTVHSKRWLFYLIALLLLQFFLRAHEPLAMPAYADESHHIRRAEVAWEFTTNPYASYIPRKLMLYYYLGLFETERVHYLLVSRLAVALITLLGGAALYAVGKRLAGARAGIMALFMAAVMPFTVFFDRMALADPLTLVMLMLATWSILLWLDKPTLQRGVFTGLLLVLPPFAKLTAFGVIAAPFAAVLIFKPHQWRIYLKSGVVMLGIFAAVWIPLLAPTVIGEFEGEEERVVLVEDYLLNIHEQDQGFFANFGDNTWQAISQTAVFYWTPALLLTGAAWLYLLRRRMRVGIFLGVMLALAWLPSIAAGSFPYTRYLEIGIPFLILMLTAGLYTFTSTIDEYERRATLERAVMLGFAVYGIAWGLNFFQIAITEPENLNLPQEDRWRYVQSGTAGYGQREAAAWLEQMAERNPQSGQVEAYAVLGSCHMLRLYLHDPGVVDLTCADIEDDKQMLPETVEQIAAAAQEHNPMYMLVERDLNSNFDDLPLTWEFVRLFPRPYEGVTIEVWKVTPAEAGENHRLPEPPAN